MDLVCCTAILLAFIILSIPSPLNAIGEHAKTRFGPKMATLVIDTRGVTGDFHVTKKSPDVNLTAHLISPHTLNDGFHQHRCARPPFPCCMHTAPAYIGVGPKCQNLRRTPPIYGIWDRIFNNIGKTQVNPNDSFETPNSVSGNNPATQGGREGTFAHKNNFRGDMKHRKHRKQFSKPYHVRKRDVLSKQQAEYLELYKKLDAWGKSKDKTERQLHTFLKEDLEDLTEEIKENADDTDQEGGKGVEVDDEADTDEITNVNEFLEALDEPLGAQDLHEEEWDKYLREIREKVHKKIESIQFNVPETDLVKKCMAVFESDDKCGFKYPIVGTPDDIYSDPNIYRHWGRTLLSQTSSTNATRPVLGYVEPKDESLEDMMVSLSPLRDDTLIGRKLQNIHLDTLAKRLDQQKPATPPGQSTSAVNVSVKVPVSTVNAIPLEKNIQNRLQLLKSLHAYNPFDEYIKIKRSSGNLFRRPIKVGLTINAPTGDTDSDDSRKVDESFVRDYLHHFVMLPRDVELLKTFEKAEYLLDVLRHFDYMAGPKELKQTKFVDLFDRLLKVIFPDTTGFPDHPRYPEFPATLKQHGKADIGRVNVACALMALVQVHKLATPYAADFFTEQRVKTILDIIEGALVLEMKRINMGISKLQLNICDMTIGSAVGTRMNLCEINDAFLGTLVATLSLWNIQTGIENILDTIMLLTVQMIKSFRPKYLMAVLLGLTNLHALPKSVFQRFVDKIVAHIHEHLKKDITARAADSNAKPWMDFDVASRLLHVLVRFPTSLTRDFMIQFLELYKQEYLEQPVPPFSCCKLVDLQEETLAGTKDAKAGWESFYTHTFEVERGVEGKSKKKPRMVDDDKVIYLDKLKKYDLDAHALRGRWLQNLWTLFGCISWCGLSKRYTAFIAKLNIKSYIAELDFDSIGACSIIQVCNDWDHLGSKLVQVALKRLLELRFAMTSEQFLDALEIYADAVELKTEYPKPRITFDHNFLLVYFCHFKLWKRPLPMELLRAVQTLKRFVPYLKQRHIDVLFADVLSRLPEFNFLTRLGLYGEYLEYKIHHAARILEIAGQCRVRIDKAWKHHWDVVETFMHTLTFEDITTTLRAMEAARYSGLVGPVNKLLDRACHLLEVTKHIVHEDILDILEASANVNVVPVQLLRWYLYTLIKEIPRDIIPSEPPEYDIDFRGWKRPYSKEKHVETLALRHQLFVPVEMQGSKVACSPALEHTLPQHTNEDASILDKSLQMVEPVTSDHIKRLFKVFAKINTLDYYFGRSDAALVSRALATLSCHDAETANSIVLSLKHAA